MSTHTKLNSAGYAEQVSNFNAMAIVMLASVGIALAAPAAAMIALVMVTA